MAELDGTGVRLADTRKTTPGLRQLEKYAVRTGGATNHRMGLGDQVLVKENHIAGARATGSAGSFSAAIKLLMERVPEDTVVGIEVTDLSELHIALESEPAYVLCDNFGTARDETTRSLDFDTVDRREVAVEQLTAIR